MPFSYLLYILEFDKLLVQISARTDCPDMSFLLFSQAFMPTGALYIIDRK
jgi:hypothetical protein